MFNTNTVAAVSTPRGKGGIAVIRISGSESDEVLNKCFRAYGKGKSPVLRPRSAVFGEITDGESVIDTGIATYFEEGRSFTGEKSAEISCHGGTAVTAAVLEAVFKAGAEPAGPGEFTRRAFINGKLSLTEAEAIGKLIDADTDAKRRLASGAARGKLKEKTEEIRKELRNVLAALYAAIDYPEEDIGNEGEERIGTVLADTSEQLQKLLLTYKTGSAVCNGVVTVICGTPNSGKSSLYNLLCRKELAIVTDIAGTTRDTLWETVDVGGITLRLADTAGIRESSDTVERIGVDRAKNCVMDAELVIAVFDGSKELSAEDKALIGEMENIGTEKIAVINKSDIDSVFKEEVFEGLFTKTVTMSAKKGDGLEMLYSAIAEIYNSDKLRLDNDALIWDVRHKSIVENVISLLEEARDGLKRGDAADAVCTLAETALAELSLLDGRGVTEEIVSEIFNRFCVGK